jgi:hypothetical protein
MTDWTVNRFRKVRGRILKAQIAALATHLRRAINVLDVGGRPDYWENVGLENVSSIEILNYNEAEFSRPAPSNIFLFKLGDARDLIAYPDKSVDMVHSNSVIEHVGRWEDMQAMAREVRRVGKSGWIQTPAWEFPIEPHFQAPFLHWFGQPMRRRMMMLSSRYRKFDTAKRRQHVDRINLLSKDEVRTLFPDCAIRTEWLLLPKSYLVQWMQTGVELPGR